MGGLRRGVMGIYFRKGGYRDGCFEMFIWAFERKFVVYFVGRCV